MCVNVCSRYDRFNDAFEHVCTVIDPIYKVKVDRVQLFIC